MEPKQVIIVRKDLNMRKGKMCAQVAHASMKVLLDRCGHGALTTTTVQMSFLYDKESPWRYWLAGLFTKICVSCDSEQELEELYQKARDAKLPCAMIIDAGLTEFGGVPTKTCIAIGPDDPEEINKITGHLKLL